MRSMWMSIALLAATACGGAPSGNRSIDNAGAVVAAGPPPRVTWRPAGEVPGEGSFEITGLPAVSADGRQVLVAVMGEDGARGMANLALVIRDRGDAVVDTRVVLAAGDDPPAAAPDVTEANAWLAGTHRAAGWVPLTVAPVTADDDSILEATQWDARVDGVHLHFTQVGQLVVAADEATVVDREATDWLMATAPMYPGAGPDEQCYNPPYLTGVHVDAGRRIALAQVSYIGTDSCWEPDTAHHVVAW